MIVRMRHPEVPGEIEAEPGQVPHYQAAGWERVEPQPEAAPDVEQSESAAAPGPESDGDAAEPETQTVAPKRRRAAEKES